MNKSVLNGRRVISRSALAKMYPERFGEEYRVPVRIARDGRWAVDTVYPNSAYAWRASLPSLVDELIRQSKAPTNMPQQNL
jgi:hypothetical protein